MFNNKIERVFNSDDSQVKRHNCCFYMLHSVNTSNKQKLVERVFSNDDLQTKGHSSGFSMWHSVNITNKPELVEKVLNHLKTAKNYRIYVSHHGSTFSCDTEKFGKVKCSFHGDFNFFGFGVLKNGTRYDINYTDSHPELKDFLKDMFQKIIDEFKEDSNL